LVNATDVKVLILASTLSVTPQETDRITIRGVTYSVLGVIMGDPAKATWECRCKQ
jgi:hypothetical protein